MLLDIEVNKYSALYFLININGIKLVFYLLGFLFL